MAISIAINNKILSVQLIKIPFNTFESQVKAPNYGIPCADLLVLLNGSTLAEDARYNSLLEIE